MTIKIMRFNNNGIEALSNLLTDCRNGATPKISPLQLASDPNYIESIEASIKIDEKKKFSTRLALGDYLVKTLKADTIENHVDDNGLWTWLACVYLDQLTGNFQHISEDAHYIFYSNDFRKRYRHSIGTTVWGCFKHGTKHCAFLFSNVDKLFQRGELTEQLSNRSLIWGTNALKVASRLYTNKAGDGLKPGSSTRGRDGNWEEFIDKINKLDANYDIVSMSEDRISELIPELFDKVKKWK